ncbi:MAG: Mov34/MPN/PAD-1 family protein [Candidatus Bathyarchaeota archaeon]|jgi:proteasome lid subunit RPN8/RPN11
MNPTLEVTVPKEFVQMILESAKTLHPKETLFLLRGKTRKDQIKISGIVIPPSATYGKGFASLPLIMMPIDFSIIGTAHSHPARSSAPSVEDLNHALGKILLVAAYPYKGSECLAVYNRKGEKLKLTIT